MAGRGRQQQSELESCLFVIVIFLVIWILEGIWVAVAIFAVIFMGFFWMSLKGRP
jgi:Flp pilus assembly protein TadB